MRSFEARGARPSGRLKVGYVLKRFPRLSETFVLNEILELERQGVEVEVFSLRKAKEEMPNELFATLKARVNHLADTRHFDAGALAGTQVQEAELDAGRLAPLMPGKSTADREMLALKARAIADMARDRGLHHLHAHFASDATTAALIASRISGLPFSFTAHARDIFHCYVSRDVDDAVRRLKLREARFVATVSDFNKQHLDHLAARDSQSNVVRLYNGIDLERFAPPARSSRAGGPILAVGRLVEKKGLEHVIDACRILRDKGMALTCEIVGEGPLRSSLEARIAASGLEGTVKLLGAQPHERVRELMQRAAMFVLPCVVSPSGDRDGLPTVLLEALASGLPSISTRIAGIPEIIRHERTGLLVEPATPLELASAIERLQTDRRLVTRLAAEGRRHAQRNFDLAVNVSVLARMFRTGQPISSTSVVRTDDANRLSVG